MMTNVEQYKLQKLFKYIQDAANEWDDGEHVRTYFSALFYQHIYGMKRHFSGYTSRDAIIGPERGNTEDHFLSPRLVFRALMDQCPDLLHDFNQFADLVRLCQTTIRITKDQNNSFDIKFRMRGEVPVIKKLTVEKYDMWGWHQDGKGFLTEYVDERLVPQKFPLKHLVPNWLTTFEEKYVRRT